MTKSGNVDIWDVNVKQGDDGCRKAADWLHNCLGWGIEPYDKELDVKHGIDITAKKDSGELVTLDVKNDFSIIKSGNVVFEIQNKHGAVGWGLNPDHTNGIILIVNGRNINPLPEMWIMRMDDLRDYYLKYGYQLKAGRNEREHDKVHYVLMPLVELRQWCGYWYTAGDGASPVFIGDESKRWDFA